MSQFLWYDCTFKKQCTVPVTLNTKINLHNGDDNVNDGNIHDIIIMLAYIQFTSTYYYTEWHSSHFNIL